MTTVDDCVVFTLPRISRPEGQLTAVENGREVPFPIRRVYYLYDVPGGESRGGHAHKELQQLIVAVTGSFDVVLDDGDRKRIVALNRAHVGLYVPRLIWRDLVNFSSGSVCLVLASQEFSEEDYLRRYDDFLTWRGQRAEP